MYSLTLLSFLSLFSVTQSQLSNYGGFTPNNSTEAMTIASIQNVLALFGYALDNKNFDALRDVYTPDVNASVAREPITNLEDLIQFYNGTALGDVVTQHTTHSIFVYNITTNTANSISYANAL